MIDLKKCDDYWVLRMKELWRRDNDVDEKIWNVTISMCNDGRMCVMMVIMADHYHHHHHQGCNQYREGQIQSSRCYHYYPFQPLELLPWLF